MFISAVSSLSLAVFTNLSIIEIDNSKLVLSDRQNPEAQIISTQVIGVESGQDASDTHTSPQGDAAISVWAKGAAGPFPLLP